MTLWQNLKNKVNITYFKVPPHLEIMDIEIATKVMDISEMATTRLIIQPLGGLETGNGKEV